MNNKKDEVKKLQRKKMRKKMRKKLRIKKLRHEETLL